jgi:alpha-ketoglutarate-dependent taurine dioxygenase
MTQKESNAVFAEIDKELFVDKYIYDHWYKGNNDFCLFDNSITLHRRLGETKNRLAYRVQHDYSNLQDGFWQPYLKEKFQKLYVDEIVDFVTTAGIKDFKLPV